MDYLKYIAYQAAKIAAQLETGELSESQYQRELDVLNEKRQMWEEEKADMEYNRRKED